MQQDEERSLQRWPGGNKQAVLSQKLGVTGVLLDGSPKPAQCAFLPAPCGVVRCTRSHGSPAALVHLQTHSLQVLPFALAASVMLTTLVVVLCCEVRRVPFPVPSIPAWLGFVLGFSCPG